ncbi:uncharacterized protein [Montipora capricornis]|uniref:uncharacterized protein n=1 Tax=Montipora capricornis TaxID=246305 RepID=UPI0035F1E4B0
MRSDESFVSDDLTLRSPSSPSESATLTALELDESSFNRTPSENTMDSSTSTTDVISALSSSDTRSSESVEQYILEPSASSPVHAQAADHQICSPVKIVLNAGAVQSVDHLQPVQRSFSHVGESVAPSTTMGPLTLEERKLAMKLQIQRDFQQLQICREENEEYRHVHT